MCKVDKIIYNIIISINDKLNIVKRGKELPKNLKNHLSSKVFCKSSYINKYKYNNDLFLKFCKDRNIKNSTKQGYISTLKTWKM